MVLAALILSALALLATVAVGLLVHTRTSKALRRIDAMLIANKSLDEVRQIERLLEDTERSRHKRGRVVQREDGSWGIDWTITVGS